MRVSSGLAATVKAVLDAATLPAIPRNSRFRATATVADGRSPAPPAESDGIARNCLRHSDVSCDSAGQWPMIEEENRLMADTRYGHPAESPLSVTSSDPSMAPCNTTQQLCFAILR